MKADFPKLIAVARMEAVSYRASAAYYPQSDQFILFAQQQEGLLSLLDPSRQGELKSFLAAALRIRPQPAHDGRDRDHPEAVGEGRPHSLKKLRRTKKAMLARLAASTVPPLFEMLKKDMAQESSKDWFEGETGLGQGD